MRSGHSAWPKRSRVPEATKPQFLKTAEGEERCEEAKARYDGGSD